MRWEGKRIDVNEKWLCNLRFPDDPWRVAPSLFSHTALRYATENHMRKIAGTQIAMERV